MQTRDWLTILGFVVTLGLFLWKLAFDRDVSKLRETISYLEKRSDKLREFWAVVKNAPDQMGPLSLLDADKLSSGFEQLELIAYLVRRNAFEEEAVYQVCWYQYSLVRRKLIVRAWFDSKRGGDESIYANYVWLSARWSARVANEQVGNT